MDVFRYLNAERFHMIPSVLTVGKGQDADDQEEGDDEDHPHPDVTIRVSIVSACANVQI